MKYCKDSIIQWPISFSTSVDTDSRRIHIVDKHV